MRHLANWQHNRRFPDRLVFQFLLAFTIAFLALVSSQAQETNNVRAVRLSDVEGTVQLLDNEGVVFDQAHPNMPVTEGMRIKTGDNGRVEVQFEDGSVVRITPNSTISFNQLQRTSQGEALTQIQSDSGLSYYEINNRGGKYSVRFGPYTVTATKSSIFRLALDQNPAQLAVTRGTVHIDTGNDGGLDVLTNQTATLDLKDAASYDVAQNVSADSWDQWNSDRDQHLAQMGARATMARASSGNPDDPAWNDLDYYGNWYDMPGYGTGWMPSGVGSGWDPFGSGYWGYSSGYGGYSWISSNPWGWYPYHCGAWNWFTGPGWMWFPGNCGWGSYGNGWYPVTSVWNVPPNYAPPLRPKQPITPARGPVHMPPQQALVSVNRNPGTFQFRTTDGSKPIANPIEFKGKTIQPIEASVHPRMAGPLGESFRVTSGYVPAQTGARPGAPPVVGNPGGSRSTYLSAQPAQHNTVAPPPRYSAPPPSYHPAPSSGGSMGSSSPHYSAPSASSAPHMSSPAPSAPSGGGSHPH